MLEEREHIDNLFAENLYNYEEKAPSYLWNNIQADLKKTRRIKKYSKIRAIAASVALLMTFGLGYLSSDYALRKKYEARSVSGNHSTKLTSEKNQLRDDSVGHVSDDTAVFSIKNDQAETVVET